MFFHCLKMKIYFFKKIRFVIIFFESSHKFRILGQFLLASKGFDAEKLNRSLKSIDLKGNFCLLFLLLF